MPLTQQALAVVEAVRPYSGHREFVFPADRNPRIHCNSQTANMALKRMGFEGHMTDAPKRGCLIRADFPTNRTAPFGLGPVNAN